MIIKWIRSVIEANKKPLKHRWDEVEGCHRQYENDNCFAYAVGNCLDLTRDQIEMIESVNKDRGYAFNDVDGLLEATIALGFAKAVSMSTDTCSVPCVAIIRGSLIKDELGGTVIAASNDTHAFAITKDSTNDQYDIEDGNLGRCWLWKYSLKRWMCRRLVRMYHFET